MLNIHKSKKGTPYVWASELHKVLMIKTNLRDWMPRMIAYGFEDGTDYHQTLKNERNPKGGRRAVNWAVTVEMAKHIAMIQRSKKGKEIRQYLLGLDNKVQDGELLSRDQITALFDLCTVLGYFSIDERSYTVLWQFCLCRAFHLQTCLNALLEPVFDWI